MNQRATESSTSEESGVVSVVVGACGRAGLTANNPRLFYCAKMNSDNNSTLPEIRRQLNDAIQLVSALRTIENRLMNDCLPTDEHTEIVLQFDDVKRTVSWLQNSIRLSPKSYLLLKTLGQSPKRRVDYETVERKVWENRSKKECIPTATIKILVYRTNKKLMQYHFPYKIRPARRKKTKEILGFSLK